MPESIPPERIQLCPVCREAYDENDGHTCSEKMSPEEYEARLLRLKNKGIAQD